jgi:glycosyltransferase involved in cell wall biosynthesis
MAGILHVVLNAYTIDNRVRRAAECGRDLQMHPTVFALASDTSPDVADEGGVSVRRFRLWTRSWSKSKPVQLVKYAELCLRMVMAAKRRRPTIVHAHDVDGLVIGYLVSRICRARLIYDAHELWADPAHTQGMPKWIGRGLRRLEQFFARRADATITVSDSIADHMAQHQGLERPHVIRNIPERWPSIVRGRLRAALGIDPESIVILYQGTIGGDGVMTLAEAFRRVTGAATLVFLGDGPALEPLKARLGDLGDRVKFHPFVAPSDLPAFSGDADIGVVSVENDCLSYQYCLPNKLFELVQGRNAIVCTDLLEMRRIVDLHGFGVAYPSGDAGRLAQQLQRLIDQPEWMAQLRAASGRAAELLNWEIERTGLERLYRRLA